MPPSDRADAIAERYRSVVEHVARAARAAGRDPAEITVVAVAKTFSAAAVAEITADLIRALEVPFTPPIATALLTALALLLAQGYDQQGAVNRLLETADKDVGCEANSETCRGRINVEKATAKKSTARRSTAKKSTAKTAASKRKSA